MLSGAISGQQIRYTMDGSLPTSQSAVYMGAIPITSSTWVRARIFDIAKGSASLPYGESYDKLMASLSSYGSTGVPFRSSLPILVLNNRGGGEIANDDTYRDARLHVFDRDGSGYASIASVSLLSCPVAVKLRGSSSAGFDKKSYSLEFRNEAGSDRNLSILGLPSDSDWALISCDDFDPSFMRNAWVYEAGRRTGSWSPRTRFVELFFNQNGNELGFMESSGNTIDYRGVYVLCENIRNGSDRVDITKLEMGDTTQPNLSGGYLFKVDRAETDEFSWRTTRNLPDTGIGGALAIHRPKLADLASEQTTYLRDYFQAFENTIYADAAGGFATRNYRNYIDASTWVDHNLFNMFAKNVDGLRLSAFFLKDRGRRMDGGPLWDFDRSANSTDGRDNEFNTWVGTGDATNFFTYAWWNQLFQDIEFRQAYVDRWQELRGGILSTAEIHGILDGFFAEFKSNDADHPARRDYARWYGGPTNKNFAGEVTALKAWLENRANWIDGQFTQPPVVNVPEGIVNVGQSVTLGVPSGTTVYYRIDGLDPRAEGGAVRAGSITYSGGAIVLSSTTRLTARAWRAGSYAIPSTNWSGMVSPLYLISESYANSGNLRISGIHHNPLGPDEDELLSIPELQSSDFEWIEVMNAGIEPLNLDGVKLMGGLPVSDLEFPPFTLSPGGRGVVVKNRAAFLLRYPDREGHIVAEWRGDRSIGNEGEGVHLLDRDGFSIAWFEFEDGGEWPSRADGDGGALEFIGTVHGTAEYEMASNWRTSAEIHGSPGLSGSGPRERVCINEVLASPIWPQLDAVEIFNPGLSPVDLSGWFLSNTSGAITVEDYQRFRIPDGTVLAAGGFLVFSEEDFNPNGSWNSSGVTATEQEFSLDGFRGGRLWLISADPVSGKLEAFEDHADFTPAIPGTSLGCWPDGSDRFIPLNGVTLFGQTGSPLVSKGEPNTSPRIGAVQVSEVMYHPVFGGMEYVEIVNTASLPQSLEQWTLRGDVDYYFSPGDLLAPGESVLMVPFDPVNSPGSADHFREWYQVDDSVRLIGPWLPGNSLDDFAGEIRLWRKVDAPLDDPLRVGLMLEDEVLYESQAPWPVEASGNGNTIHRLGISQWGNDPTSWVSSMPTPGSDAGGYAGWYRDFFPLDGTLSGPGDDADGDGLANRLEYLLGMNPLQSGESPILNFIEGSGSQATLVMEYSIRRDRRDVGISSKTSTILEAWDQAEDDRLHSVDGLFEIRRTYLPMDAGRGFIRLETP
jgi:hypothetical protein